MELKVLKIVQVRSWFQLGEHMSLPGTSRIRRHHAAPTQRGRFCPSSRSSSSSSQSTHCRRHLCFHSRSLIDSCVRSAFFLLLFACGQNEVTAVMMPRDASRKSILFLRFHCFSSWKEYSNNLFHAHWLHFWFADCVFISDLWWQIHWLRYR